jgi:hypothetical protein
LGKKTKHMNLEKALEDHFWHMYRPVTKAEWDEFVSDLEMAALTEGDKPSIKRRGRPAASYGTDDRTSASYSAAQDMFQHLREFRRRNGITRIPAKVTRAILNDVMSLKPAASEEIILEYIRENKKHFRFLNED